jgi:hypothetical protein
MYDLSKIDLGNDEAEQDTRLEEYFLRTPFYENAMNGNKTLLIGRKGSGKSAIFILIDKEFRRAGNMVITITPDQYSWSALKDYKESGILPEQANTNAWRLTLLSAIVWKLNEENMIKENSHLTEYFKYMNDSYTPRKETWFLNIIEKGKGLLKGIKTQWVSFDFGATSAVSTPLRIVDETQALLQKEWPKGKIIRILIDRLDDSWDASKESIFTIIGLLKAANQINTAMAGKVIVSIFLRSDIYDNLFFDDQDKLRQYEELILWSQEDLKAIVSERVRVSLNLSAKQSSSDIWSNLFSKKPYRSKASADKYIIDRTFKRPRDMISFVRFSLEQAIRNQHAVIEPEDTRIAEEEKYSQSKFKDIVIENQKQFPYVKKLLDSLSGSLHQISSEDLRGIIHLFINKHQISEDTNSIIRLLFIWGVIGIKKQGRAGFRRRGGAHFFYYYDDPSINPLAENIFFIHPALRHYLNISEKREKRSKA